MGGTVISWEGRSFHLWVYFGAGSGCFLGKMMNDQSSRRNHRMYWHRRTRENRLWLNALFRFTHGLLASLRNLVKILCNKSERSWPDEENAPLNYQLMIFGCYSFVFLSFTPCKIRFFQTCFNCLFPVNLLQRRIVDASPSRCHRGSRYVNDSEPGVASTLGFVSFLLCEKHNKSSAN